MMQLCASTICLRDYNLNEALACIAESGYDAVELVAVAPDKHLDLMRWDAAALRKKLGDYKLELAALYPKPINIWGADAGATNMPYIRQAIELAAGLDCKRIVFSPLLPREDYDYKKLADMCEALADEMAGTEMRLCLENHYNWPLSVQDDYVELFRHIRNDRVGICVDTGHFTSAGVDMLALVDAFADRVFHVHLKDHVGTESKPLGQGETPNQKVLERLRGHGFDGYASVEIEVKDWEKSKQYVADARCYCEDVLGIINGQKGETP